MINIHHTVTSFVQLLEMWDKLQQQDGSIEGRQLTQHHMNCLR